VADVSAVADPDTGVAVYSTTREAGLLWAVRAPRHPSWRQSSPPLARRPLVLLFPYTHTAAFYDVTTGSNGSCSPAYLCTGQVGFDGPTGWGTPNGQLIAASSDIAQVFSVTFNPAILEGGSPSTGTILLTAARPGRWRNGRFDQQRPQLGYRSKQRCRSRWQPERDLPSHHGSDVYPDGRQYSGYLPGQHQRDGDADLARIADASVVGAFSHERFRRNDLDRDRHAQWSSAGWRCRRVSSSSNVAVATVPATMNIPEGATSGTFTITTLAQSSSTSATISAAYHGLTRSAVLAVTMTPGVSSISVSPSLLEGGGSATGYVYLNTTAPTGGAIVLLASSSAAATVPASITIAAGQSSASFQIATTAVTVQTAVTISATYPAGLDRDHDPHGLALTHAAIGDTHPHFGYGRHSRDGDRHAQWSGARWRSRRDSH
jgi:hypothetical protein